LDELIKFYDGDEKMANMVYNHALACTANEELKDSSDLTESSIGSTGDDEEIDESAAVEDEIEEDEEAVEVEDTDLSDNSDLDFERKFFSFELDDDDDDDDYNEKYALAVEDSYKFTATMLSSFLET
jgi:hypothetical protein